MIYGSNKSLNDQIDILKYILSKSKKIMRILRIIEECDISNCYLAAGCINQTVFNYYHGYDIDYGIGDYDIVYFDEDLSYEAEDKVIKMIKSKVNDDIELDIKNQARVHLWYYEKYGVNREKYVNVENAISRWTSTVTCIGIRLDGDKLIVCAPYGLDDLFNMIIRPVKIDCDKDIYDNKCKKWKGIWQNIKIISW